MNSPRPISPSQLLVEAAEWRVRAERGLDVHEERAFSGWLSSSQEHVAAFMEVSVVAEKVEDLVPRAIENHATRDVVPQIHPEPRRPLPRLAISLGLAASIILSIAACWLYLNVWPWKAYSSEIGERPRITLSDGSELLLNTDSRARVRFGKEEREIELLHGEASFKVEHDKSRPFIVVAGDVRVRALGTAFVVRRLEKDDVNVVVSEGSVSIQNAMESSVVKAKEIATVTPREIQRGVLTEQQLRQQQAWIDGMAIFSGETIAEAVREINRHNRLKIVVTDEVAAKARIGGAYSLSDPHRFAEDLTVFLHVIAEDGRDEEGNSVIVVRSRKR